MKTVNKALELRLDILRILSGNPCCFKWTDILERIRGEGVRVLEKDFVEELGFCTQSGLIKVYYVGPTGTIYHKITQKGREFLKKHLGERFDKNAVIYDILRFLKTPPFMQTKASILDFVRRGGNEISDFEFDLVFEELQNRKLLESALQQLGNDCSVQYRTTAEGDKYLEKQTPESNTQPIFETLKIGHIVSDTILICLRYSQPMGRKAIIRKVRPYAFGLKSREIAMIVKKLCDIGFTECVSRGYKTTEKVGAYLKQRIESLTHSDRKCDLKAGISLLFAELSCLQEVSKTLNKGADNEEK